MLKVFSTELMQRLYHVGTRVLGLYGQLQGVVVSGVDEDSDAAYAGVQAGDVITAVNREPVKNVAEFERALSKAKNGVVLTIRRDNLLLLLPLG